MTTTTTNNANENAIFGCRYSGCEGTVVFGRKDDEGFEAAVCAHNEAMGHRQRRFVEVLPAEEVASFEIADMEDAHESGEPQAEVANFCICGCGKSVGKKSKFAQGHDAKVKGWCLRAGTDKAEPGFVFPDTLVGYARANPGFTVAGINVNDAIAAA